jgi:hypothetical protein
MIDKIVEKFQIIIREISQEKGPFILFGLFEREDLVGRWDVVVSAPWLNMNSKEDFDYIADKIRSKLNNQEIMLLTRIIPLLPFDQFVKAVTSAINISDGSSEIINSNFFGIQIRHAYVFVSKPITDNSLSKVRV